jgi:hypothetical protein
MVHSTLGQEPTNGSSEAPAKNNRRFLWKSCEIPRRVVILIRRFVHYTLSPALPGAIWFGSIPLRILSSDRQVGEGGATDHSVG